MLMIAAVSLWCVGRLTYGSGMVMVTSIRMPNPKQKAKGLRFSYSVSAGSSGAACYRSQKLVSCRHGVHS
jgi:hypothetical protein